MGKKSKHHKPKPKPCEVCYYSPIPYTNNCCDGSYKQASPIGNVEKLNCCSCQKYTGPYDGLYSCN